jgi:hypothetical protein
MATLLTKDERIEIHDRIIEKCQEYKCPICQMNKMTLFDHLEEANNLGFWESLASSFSRVPYTMLVCNNCGFMSKHAIGALGLMHLYKDPFDKKEEKK